MIRQRFLVCNVIKQVGNISMKNNGNVAVQIAHKEREREREFMFLQENDKFVTKLFALVT